MTDHLAYSDYFFRYTVQLKVRNPSFQMLRSHYNPDGLVEKDLAITHNFDEFSSTWDVDMQLSMLKFGISEMIGDNDSEI
jgi:hypothetical protein